MSENVNEDLESLIDEILASYRSDNRTQRIGEVFLPSRTKIVEILEQLRQILFPGFFGTKALTDESVKFHVGNSLWRLSSELTQQINHCLCSQCSRDGCPAPDSCLSDAGKKARQFLGCIPTIREILAIDAQAAFDGDPAAKTVDEVIYSYPGFYAVVVYRLAHELVELAVPLMPRIMTEHAHSVTGCDIHPGAKIGKSFFIDHATGVVIGETTQIGDNVKIYQGVTLGALSFPKDERGRAIKGLKRHPTIEDNVTIYANATILGGQTVIGKGVTVGGNTFITQSIIPDSTVAQESPQISVRKKKKPQ